VVPEGTTTFRHLRTPTSSVLAISGADLAVADLSFISLALVLPALRRLLGCARQAEAVALLSHNPVPRWARARGRQKDWPYTSRISVAMPMPSKRYHSRRSTGLACCRAGWPHRFTGPVANHMNNLLSGSGLGSQQSSKYSIRQRSIPLVRPHFQVASRRPTRPGSQHSDAVFEGAGAGCDHGLSMVLMKDLAIADLTGAGGFLEWR